MAPALAPFLTWILGLGVMAMGPTGPVGWCQLTQVEARWHCCLGGHWRGLSTQLVKTTQVLLFNCNLLNFFPQESGILSTRILWAFGDGEQSREGLSRTGSLPCTCRSGGRAEPIRAARTEPGRRSAGSPAPLPPGGGASGRGPGGAGRTARLGTARRGSAPLSSPAMASKCPKCDKTVYFGERIPATRPRIPLPEPGLSPGSSPAPPLCPRSPIPETTLIPGCPFPKPRCVPRSPPPPRCLGVSPAAPSPSPAHLQRGAPITQSPARQQLPLPRGSLSQWFYPPATPTPGLCWRMLPAGLGVGDKSGVGGRGVPGTFPFWLG